MSAKSGANGAPFKDARRLANMRALVMSAPINYDCGQEKIARGSSATAFLENKYRG
jgi:hypothetical protein